MEQGILIVVVLCIFGLGFYIVNKIDLFLDNVLENDKEEQEGKMNSLKILFLDDFSDDELLKEIHECKSRYAEKIFDHTAIT